MTEPLISIITPVKDAKRFLQMTHDSVLAQSWTNWEWIVCDNNSGDGSWELMQNFNDRRITLLSESSGGVSSTRNKCLSIAKGQFVCMLDADDVLPSNSLKARADKLIAHPEIDFCDGQVEYWNEDMSQHLRSWQPSFEGDPTPELLNLRGTCFFGNTWMIKRYPEMRFDEDLKHSEDLMFYLTQSSNKRYTSVSQPVLKYRTGHFHAMSDSRGVEAGYRQVAAKLPGMGFSPEEVGSFRKAAQRICFRSAVKDWRIIHALKLLVAGL